MIKWYKEIKTHYVGKSGNEYNIDEYSNHAFTGLDRLGRKALPKEDYPFTFKYVTVNVFNCYN